MNTVEIFGFAAAILTTSAFVPQVVRLWRTRNTEGISLLTFSIFSVGVACWLVYGLMLQALAIILANVVTLVLAIAVVVLVIRFRAQAARRAASER